MIPAIIYEATQARAERKERAFVITLLVAFIILLINNAIWLYAWCQYDYVSETEEVTVDAEDGVANYIGHDGDINNGED